MNRNSSGAKSAADVGDSGLVWVAPQLQRLAVDGTEKGITTLEVLALTGPVS